MLSTDIPAKFNIPFANAGTKNTIPEASQIGITNGAASLTDGFPPDTFTPIGSGGVAPFGADFNGIFYEITQTLRWLMAGGLFGYDSAFSTAIGGYPSGAMLKAADGSGFFISTADNNTSDPDSGGANWLRIGTVPGTIIPFAGATVPAGYLACPTAQTNISRTTYSALFNQLGTTWGVGDGSTTFGMPWFPADYALIQANANLAAQSVGQVISHSHLAQASSSNFTGGPNVFDIIDYGAPKYATSSTGGAANLAAGVRINFCVKY